MKRAAVVVLLSMAGFAAGASEVADAVMRGDKAAVQKLVAQHADVNAPQGRWRHGASLGGVPVR